MRPRSRLLPLALAALAATSCVSPNKAGVSVDNVEANVVFGVEKKPEVVLPANTAVGEVPDEAAAGGSDFTFHNDAAGRLDAIISSNEVKAECPSAPPTAAADKPTESNITGPVREGTYIWKRIGTQTIPDPQGGKPRKKPITGFEKRIIRNVKKVDDQFDPDAYTFEMVQTLIDRNVIQVRTFLVKPHSSGQYQPGGVPVVEEPRVNEPEAGVSLVKVENFDSKGTSLGTFEPTSGLLLIGLPVDPSETFESSATDPKTGETIVDQASGKGRSRIDACGDLVDGWRVEATQSRSGATGSVAYNYLIAPQYGGVPILEEVSTTAEDGSTFDVTFSLGQLDPGPAT